MQAAPGGAFGPSHEMESVLGGNTEGPRLFVVRYRVEKALAFTNTGGVYLAGDQETGLKVAIKEARPGTVIWRPRKVCLDSITVLKNEYATLERLRDDPPPNHFNQ